MCAAAAAAAGCEKKDNEENRTCTHSVFAVRTHKLYEVKYTWQFYLFEKPYTADFILLAKCSLYDLENVLDGKTGNSAHISQVLCVWMGM